jgi:hypothetical protein
MHIPLSYTTYACHCFSQVALESVQPLVVSEMLGHSFVAFTLQTYGRVQAEMRKPARAAMERLFGGAFDKWSSLWWSRAIFAPTTIDTNSEIFRGGPAGNRIQMTGLEVRLDTFIIGRQSSYSR